MKKIGSQTNGKITKIEKEMVIDELKENLPYLIKSVALQSKLLKAKYDSLITEGFTEKQALEVIKARPLYE